MITIQFQFEDNSREAELVLKNLISVGEGDFVKVKNYDIKEGFTLIVSDKEALKAFAEHLKSDPKIVGIK